MTPIESGPSLSPVNRRAFLAATVGTMLHVRLGQAQGQVTQPVLSETDCPLEVITPTAHDGHRGLGVMRKPPGRGPFPAIIYLHGGITTVPLATLRANREGRRKPFAVPCGRLCSGRPHLSESRCRSAVFRFVGRFAGGGRVRASAALRRSRKHRRVWMQWRWRLGTRGCGPHARSASSFLKSRQAS